MKVVCICDVGVPERLMAMMKKLPDCEVTCFTEPTLNDVKASKLALRAVEEGGPEAWKVSDEMLEAIKEAEAIVVHVAPVGKTVMDAAPNLKVVGVLRTGVENVDLELCKERGIQVYNAEGRNSVAVADQTVAMMLCEMRNLARGHAAMVSGQWVKMFPNTFYIRDMCQCTVGIIGSTQVEILSGLSVGDTVWYTEELTIFDFFPGMGGSSGVMPVEDGRPSGDYGGQRPSGGMPSGDFGGQRPGGKN